MKNVLIVYYSQTGQQKDIVDNIVKPLAKDAEVKLTYYQIKPVHKFPFPWTKNEFFDVFPETFLQIPMELDTHENDILSDRYDLIILSYQIWFLSVSLPVISFLKSHQAKKLFENTNVITIIGCRNMWVMAQEKMKLQLVNLKAKLVGNIVFTDKQNNHVSLITLLHWLFKGEKTSYLGIFPKPGVPDKDINESDKFGESILDSLKKGKWNHLQEQLLSKGAVHVKPLLVFIEKRGTFLFSKWARFIIKKGGPGQKSREPWLKVFYYYLLIALWGIAPVVTLLFNLIYLPTYFLFKKSVNYYKSVILK
ncbi:dialkylresorcinol condensing enzyme DarA [Apibacter raozihei]|uniref:dialkylrecorsinol condensing enzyme DarA n=1 Tax=Apibacter raozihei TaxID=2500547 RepID=UPI000FE2D38A|nr:dialkylrecorsinol condensing enzyme DarA [Apibacter raozihei]